jgi:hypothetical protein
MLVYCVTIWNTLWQFDIIYGHFGIVCGRWLYFSRFGMFGPRKIWQPGLQLSLFQLKLQNSLLGLVAAGMRPRPRVVLH